MIIGSIKRDAPLIITFCIRCLEEYGMRPVDIINVNSFENILETGKVRTYSKKQHVLLEYEATSQITSIAKILIHNYCSVKTALSTYMIMSRLIMLYYKFDYSIAEGHEGLYIFRYAKAQEIYINTGKYEDVLKHFFHNDINTSIEYVRKGLTIKKIPN